MLFSKCEGFVNQLQLKEEDDVLSNSSLNQSEEEEFGSLAISRNPMSKRRKRKFKLQSKNTHKFILEFLLCITFLIGYFIVNYFVTNILSNNMPHFVKELNYTSQIEPQYYFLNNVYRIMILDGKFKILGKNSTETLKNLIPKLYDLNSEMQKVFFDNFNNFNKF